MPIINQKIKSSTFPKLFSERLELVPLSQNDLIGLFELRSDPDVNKHLDRPLTTSKEEMVSFIEKITSGVQEGKWLYWKIQLKESTELLGTICLWMFNKESSKCDIGYELRKAFWGVGYMNEAVNLVIEYGFKKLELRSIEAYTAEANASSNRLLENCGFSFAKRDNSNLIYFIENPYKNLKERLIKS